MKYQVQQINKMIYIVLDTEKGLKITLSPIGASIVSIIFDGKEMTMTSEDSRKLLLNPHLYHGKTIGPVGNRIEKGLVEINGVNYQTDTNEFGNCLHGGKFGLSHQKFKYTILDTKECKGVIFSLKKKDMADGLPGTIVYSISYAIKENDNTLYLSFNARSNKDTLIALTNHAYFTLGDSDLSNIKLMIPSHKYVETRKDDLIPVGVKEVNDVLDFQKPKRIMKNIDDPFIKDHRSNGFDHCFYLDKDTVTLENNDYLLKIVTNFNSVQIYSDNYEDAEPIKWVGTEEKMHRALAMEPQDSIYNRSILKKNEFYSRFINYIFTKK